MKLRLGADAPEQNPALWAQLAARRLNAESPAGWPIPEVRRRSLYESPIVSLLSQRLPSEMRSKVLPWRASRKGWIPRCFGGFLWPEGHSIVRQENEPEKRLKAGLEVANREVASAWGVVARGNSQILPSG